MSLDPTRTAEHRVSLADALRDLRKASGLSGARLAERCQLSQSKISRIETGRLLPTIVDVERLLAALGVNGTLKTDLLDLARVANAEYQDLRERVRRGLHHLQRELAGLDAAATSVRHFLPSLITGLLQVPEYVQAAMNSPVDPGYDTCGGTQARTSSHSPRRI